MNDDVGRGTAHERSLLRRGNDQIPRDVASVLRSHSPYVGGHESQRANADSPHHVPHLAELSWMRVYTQSGVPVLLRVELSHHKARNCRPNDNPNMCTVADGVSKKESGLPSMLSTGSRYLAKEAFNSYRPVMPMARRTQSELGCGAVLYNCMPVDPEKVGGILCLTIMDTFESESYPSL
ncbi:hypothetical protein BDN72DRAFT_857756 [Pluteus cervinus]|uniref:Uncharacterized protein n=1 Tax=Pluteus cervinus TaxID=181527 RepID=A0ACD3AU60_9AGAR|nr:hypothetical protein BDN72DRAFT_857756 [Pluteus cervinus]